jgi:hypothetical protein
MAGRLHNKVAVIVGATSGLGRATALLFAREGASLAVAGRRAGLLQDLAQQIASETGAVTLAVPCDAAERSQVAGRRSRMDKLEEYRKIGVVECWLVSPEADTIEVLRLEPAGIRTAARFGVGDTLRSDCLPRLEAPVAPSFEL